MISPRHAESELGGNQGLVDQLNKIKQQKQTSQFPMSATECLQFHTQHLTEYERNEIQEYNQIYYINTSNDKKVPISSSAVPSQNNFGFDTDKNEYIAY